MKFNPVVSPNQSATNPNIGILANNQARNDAGSSLVASNLAGQLNADIALGKVAVLPSSIKQPHGSSFLPIEAPARSVGENEALQSQKTVLVGKFEGSSSGGYGRLTLSNGSYYDGHWENGVPHGYGIVFHNNISSQVTYQNGRLVNIEPSQTTFLVNLVSNSHKRIKAISQAQINSVENFVKIFQDFYHEGIPVASFVHFDGVFKFDRSSAAVELNTIKRNKIEKKNLVAVLVRKSVQNIDYNEWKFMDDSQKKVYIENSFDLALKFAQVDNPRMSDKIRKHCNRIMDLEKLKNDHLLAKQSLILVDYFNYSDYFHEATQDYIYKIIIPKYTKNIPEFERKMREDVYRDGAHLFPANAALAVTESLFSLDYDCANFVFKDLVGGECQTPGTYISLDIADEMLRKLGFYKVDNSHHNEPGVILMFGGPGMAGEKTVEHYAKCIHKGVWLAKHGDQSKMLSIDPDFEKKIYGDLLAVYKSPIKLLTEQDEFTCEDDRAIDLESPAYDELSDATLRDDGYNSDLRGITSSDDESLDDDGYNSELSDRARL